MTGLDGFALLALSVLAFAAVGIRVLLGMMPGRIARQRNHPQADAIGICGWWGLLTMGLRLSSGRACSCACARRVRRPGTQCDVRGWFPSPSPLRPVGRWGVRESVRKFFTHTANILPDIAGFHREIL